MQLITMKFIIIFILNFYLTLLCAEELIITMNGKRTINESINIGDNVTRSLIKNESTFTDNRGNYGMSTCLGTLEKKMNNVEFNLKCEGIDQNNEKFFTKVYREKGEEQAGIGTVEFIGGEGFYKSLIGKKCKYAIRYFRADIFFFQQVCKL